LDEFGTAGTAARSRAKGADVPASTIAASSSSSSAAVSPPSSATRLSKMLRA
jgi:hypothetical protein